jgi:hypothetical protein
VTGDGVTGEGVTGEGVKGEGVTGEGVTGDGVTGEGVTGEGATGAGTSGVGTTGEGVTGEDTATAPAALAAIKVRLVIVFISTPLASELPSRRNTSSPALSRARARPRLAGDSAVGEVATRRSGLPSGAPVASAPFGEFDGITVGIVCAH